MKTTYTTFSKASQEAWLDWVGPMFLSWELSVVDFLALHMSFMFLLCFFLSFSSSLIGFHFMPPTCCTIIPQVLASFASIQGKSYVNNSTSTKFNLNSHLKLHYADLTVPNPKIMFPNWCESTGGRDWMCLLLCSSDLTCFTCENCESHSGWFLFSYIVGNNDEAMLAMIFRFSFILKLYLVACLQDRLIRCHFW